MGALKRDSAAVAIVGMAFRLPGDIADEDELWQALQSGTDLVSTVPAERWAVDRLQHPNRTEPGRSVTFSAGVLSRVDQFDASFHGISPREAAWLDPQQRLLLELAWEAMENAGCVPSRLAGTNTAVYVGISGVDYGMRGLHDLASMTAHSMTGNTLSIAANRLSYVFDLHGPSMAVDTACSSSLVALHQACQSLLSGEAEQALVGGVNMLLHPYPFVGFSKASMISAQGRSRPFDASADGYVRAEGGAVLLLKPLGRALAEGDSIEAVILGSGVNSDGRRKTGLTIPSNAGQSELMRRVLGRAGISASAVDYVEAHGTGTPVGDPIEAHAIGEVYGRNRPTPVPIGSIKSNVGHLEPASGLAGLVKTVLMLKHRTLAPSAHLRELNSRIDFAALNLDVVTTSRPVPAASARPLVMAVSSFGFGGTNAHVLLQEAPPPGEVSIDEPPPRVPLVLSARTAEALRELAGRYAAVMDTADPAVCYDIARAAALHREPLEKRLWINGETPATTAHALAAYARGGSPQAIQHEDALAEPGKIAFVYSGNGSQWPGMGRRLMAESREFAATIGELDEYIAPRAGFSIRAALLGELPGCTLDDTAVAQPLLFAVQVGVTRLLRGWGIEAEGVAGHSVGEIAAAWAAGALSLAQAAEVICARSAAQSLTRGTGRMAAVGLSEAAARDALKQCPGCASLEIAGVNSPSNITVAGTLGELATLRSYLEGSGIFFRLLDLDYAFHSRFMSPVKHQIETTLASLLPQTGNVPFVSTVTGSRFDGRRLTADYWWRNVREPVQFDQSVQALAQQGCRFFLEVGPNPILQRYMREALAAHGVTGRIVPSLRRDDDGIARIDEAAMRAHLARPTPKLEVLFPRPGRRVRLPNYPWQRERHWHPHTTETPEDLARPRVHPLLGWRVETLDGTWENALDPTLFAFLADHKVAGAITFPAAGYAEMALAAARDRFGGDRVEVEELEILAPIVFEPDQSRSVRFQISEGDASFRIRSRPRLSDDPWVLNAVGRLVAQPAAVTVPPEAGEVRGRTVDPVEHYARTAAIGLDYGPAFRSFAGGTCSDEALSGRIELTPAATDEAAYLLHPARLDACFQALVDVFADEIAAGHGQPLLPVKIGRLRLLAPAPAAGFRARIVRRSRRTVLVDFLLCSATGEVVAAAERCRFRAAPLQRAGVSQPRLWQTTAKLLDCRLQQNRLWATRDCAEWTREAQQTITSGEFAAIRQQVYFREARPLLDALVIAYAHAAFKHWQARDPAGFQQSLAVAESIDPRLKSYVQWLAAQLEQAQLLRSVEGTWQVDAADAPSPDDIWRTILGDAPDLLPELLLVGRIGRALPDLLCGESPLESLQESLRHTHQRESLFANSPAYAGMNRALESWLTAAARAWPAHRRLRILEVSQAWADLPQLLGPALPADRTDYVIAGLDDARSERVESQYKGHPFVTLARLSDDLGVLAAEERLPASYDIVILHHWLSDRHNLRAALVGLRRHLAPDGTLFPLPKRVFPASRVVEAFRYMQQSRQIGKVVVSHDRCPAQLERLQPGTVEALRFERDGTYLVTGGRR